jgi:hypothetical protein
MGGPRAPDDMSKTHLTQVWLAVSDKPLALSTGGYFYHKTLRAPNPVARNRETQDRLIEACADLSKVIIPAVGKAILGALIDFAGADDHARCNRRASNQQRGQPPRATPPISRTV